MRLKENKKCRPDVFTGSTALKNVWLILLEVQMSDEQYNYGKKKQGPNFTVS